jgi:hypothetical protein
MAKLKRLELCGSVIGPVICDPSKGTYINDVRFLGGMGGQAKQGQSRTRVVGR